jgi:hypothetical protein
MWNFFATFYVNDAYFALRNPVFLQIALDVVVKLFECVGLETNCLTQAMVCTPGRIQTQLPTANTCISGSTRAKIGKRAMSPAITAALRCNYAPSHATR